ncbi:MAG: DUF835 domain-containing protein [Palaeococcus sp.]|uniref:DUF835 domain-containing protein n=1 Tax=Palaeococcus sp. (in: euryarchaeotes) TaxID=2820298 RepID=UPI0025EF2504|nr:DUF835 domain-containing protein [Palaeococcus sp. (in: euryarchaeotes)]MCD6559039.1 DUF835 domain-containing protein [Palaeococcus sp. (in: euryarchaeotes)]
MGYVMDIVRVAIALMVELILIAVFAVSLRYRNRVIEHYPGMRKAYDYMLSGWLLGAISKLVFLGLDLEDCGVIKLSPSTRALMAALGNILFALALVLFLLGWMFIITSVLVKYTLVPTLEFEEKENQKGTKAPHGVYLCLSRGKAYAVFLKFLSGRAGLIISRVPPKVIQRELKLKKTPVIWITKMEGENTIHPSRLPYLLEMLIGFMRREDTAKVILFEGLEYMIMENGFESMFKFLTTLKDYALLHKSTVIIPIEKEILTQKEFTLLKREFPVLEEVLGE